MHSARDGEPTLGSTCHAMISSAGDELLDRARHMNAVRPDVTIPQLLKIVSAIALATEEEPDGPGEAGQLLNPAIDGVRAR
ncbi:hypothetical protein AB0A70_19410 [Streptomyces morookaense]|uniref:SbtR family transcriptional regulator n=1 Tax=Streptomyces morookaense TaxID=1970 RepID=UPI0033CBFE5E